MHPSFDDDDDSNNNKNSDNDIIIHDNKQGTCTLIDVVVLGVRNVIKKEVKKILKYKDLITEIQYLWNVQVKVILVIIVATGTISKSLRQYLSNLPESKKLRNCKKQPYWAPHTYCGKY